VISDMYHVYILVVSRISLLIKLMQSQFLSPVFLQFESFVTR
jgi:hypothetical protein